MSSASNIGVNGPSDYVLETVNLFYTGHIEPATWVKQFTGTIRSGLILRDVSFEIHSGEIMAILGSKGSGKKALLDVISCRARDGPRKGYVLLNGVNINRRLFQSVGGYVSGTNSDDLVERSNLGLTVHQILFYQASLSLRVNSSVRSVRVRQILSEIALTQVASYTCDKLTISEKRRLAIGVQLIKDPVLLLADEPAWNLDPLNTYFVISILSNYVKKYGRIVVLTMEKPRSDIFPFLDRVTYLCLGDVVYSGNTRLMLDYFRTIGFPCPEVENPLMYYLCLSTVNRRSHDKFIESNNQINLLVDKFKLEGSSFRKIEGRGMSPMLMESVGSIGYTGRGSTPLHALGSPSWFLKLGILILRNYSSTFQFSRNGLKNIFFKLIFLPFLFFLMWIFYFGLQTNLQQTYVTLNGLVLNTLFITYTSAIWSTIVTFESVRDSFYIESRQGLYTGPLFLLANSISSVPFTLLTCLIGSRIVFECTRLETNTSWLLLCCVLIACFSLAQQQTYSIMLTFKNKLLAKAALFSFHYLTIVLASCTVRALKALPEWLYYLSYVTQPRYAGAFLNRQYFDQIGELKGIIWSNDTHSQINREMLCSTTEFGRGVCRYLNGTYYLKERYYFDSNKNDLDLYMNFGICFTFPVGMFIINLLLYSFPMNNLIKKKFRD